MAPNAVDAAIKRMTAQIPQPTIETAEGAAQTRPAPAAAPAKKSTSRIPLPTTPISAAVDAPKTIKIQPLAGITPPLAAQPSAPVAPMGESQPPQASKSKTSRIPLEAAMGVSQSSEANAPRTIKLKRPGDMSAVKVAVPGAQAGTPTETDTSAITQRKTIRVKRPTAPTVAEGEGAAAADDAAAAALAAERLAAIQATAPERHGAPFMVAAALCVVVLIGLLLVFAAQIFGPNASLTQLSVWPGIDIPLPGSIQVES